ncbi:MAG: ribosome biogenesis GTPase Der [Candidatus Cloacimonadales bacterium]
MRRDVLVAIVGRPNVGKSTLFNRLCKQRRAIIDFEEGITRDRKYADVEWDGKKFRIVDTGGLVFNSGDQMDDHIRLQAEIAIQEADFILFLVDGQTGITDFDQRIAKMLSPMRDKTMLVVNKVDNEKIEMEIFDFLRLGFGEPYPIAANSGRNSGNFMDELLAKIPARDVDDFEELIDTSIKVAIVGKPNVGKSSIVNRLVGQDTVIVTDIPGTTRDAIDSKLKYHGQELTLIDTAGLRKKTRVKYGVEYFSAMRTIDTIDRADVILLIVSADEEISVQEKKIASYVKRHYKNLIIVVNKWDLPEKDNHTLKEVSRDILEQLQFVDYAPLLFVSALTGQRVNKILELILKVKDESERRIPTSQLNEFVKTVIDRRPPSHKTGTMLKIYYITQPDTDPPTFIFFCNSPRKISDDYKKFLHNQIRKVFKFEGATIKMIFKGKDANEPDIIY